MTLLPNRVEIPLLQYATSICGATFVPYDLEAINPKRSNELQNFITRLKPDAVFVANSEDAASVDLAIESLKEAPPKTLVILDGLSKSKSNHWMSFLDLTPRNGETIAREQELLELAKIRDPDRIDLISFTSGTSSGSPKGCPRHAGANATAIDSQANVFRFNKDSRYLLSSAYFRIIAPILSVAVWQVALGITHM